MPQAIVFDFDGVIADTEPLHHRALADVFEPMGLSLSYEQYLEELVGYDDRDLIRICWRRVAPGRGEVTDAQMRTLIDRKAEAFEAVVERGLTAVPGVLDFVPRAAAALPIAIASGATRRDIDLILRKLGLAPHFSAIVTADDVERSKPDPETYARAVRLLAAARPAMGLEPAHCLAIEDTDAGITSARGAGLLTLGLTTTGDAASVARAHRVATDFRSLSLDMLQQWFG